MIVNKDGFYESRNDLPNTNWNEEEYEYLVDETTVEGQALAKKIFEHAPYVELVIEDGKLVDVTPTERPDPPIVNEKVDEEKIAMAEAIVDLESRLSKLEGGK